MAALAHTSAAGAGLAGDGDEAEVTVRFCACPASMFNFLLVLMPWKGVFCSILDLMAVQVAGDGSLSHVPLGPGRSKYVQMCGTAALPR